MIEDSLLQYQLRKLEEHIDRARDDLEISSTSLEDIRYLQGYVAAFRVMRDILQEQHRNWIRGEEEAETRVTSLERMLDLVQTDDEP